MKINNFPIKIFFLYIISLSLYSTSKLTQLKYNQLTDYPNTFEAAVSKKDLQNAKFVAPLLSRSLFEENPQRKLRKKEFMSIINYSNYKLTRGELEQIFVFSDLNHDDLIDQTEWDAFTALFVYPFEACDKSGKYLLNEEDFKTCFDKDPSANLINIPQKFSVKKYKIIMDTVSTRKNSKINFSDYLIIRRAMFGWKDCHSDTMYISVTGFKCALKTAVPIKYNLKLESERFYNAGLKLANNKGLTELDFISYLRIIYFSYVFSILNLPNNIAFIEKTQFIKAIKEDRFPTFFSEGEIETIYKLTNNNPFQNDIALPFEGFCFFFNLHRLFYRNSIKKEKQIDLTELEKIIDDYLFPAEFMHAIDNSKTKFEQAEYLEVSMVLHRLRLNERDFYYSFKSREEPVYLIFFIFYFL